MNVLEEIKKEHNEAKELIKKIENSEGETKKQLFQELYATIKGHHEAEEIVLFPDVKEKSEDEGKEVVREMIEEHSLVAYQFSVI